MYYIINFFINGKNNLKFKNANKKKEKTLERISEKIPSKKHLGYSFCQKIKYDISQLIHGHSYKVP